MDIFNPAVRRTLSLSKADQERIVRNEEQIKNTETIVKIADIPNFLFKSMEELWAAKASRRIEIFSPVYAGEVISSLGSRSEILTNMFFTSLPFAGLIGYLVAAIMTSKYVLLVGIPVCFIGYFLFHPSAFLGFFLLPLLYFLRGSPVWLAVLIGFYVAISFSFIARIYASMVIERIAISSEVFFCYLFCRRVISVKDTQTKKVYRTSI